MTATDTSESKQLLRSLGISTTEIKLAVKVVAAYPDPKRAVYARARMAEYAGSLNDREAWG